MSPQLPTPLPEESPSGAEASEVVVRIATRHSVEAAWRAITEPACLSRWFGDWLPLARAEGRARLDFGDGDFFLIERIAAEPPLQLSYRWRFLGTGPEDAITWKLTPLDIGCLLTVSDREPGRTGAACEEMKEGWLDFLRRLDRYLETGESSRYAFRPELDGSIELPAPPRESWRALFETAMQAGWLPLNGPIAPNTLLVPSDGEPPDALRIVRVGWNPPESVRFELATGNGAPPMEVRLALCAHGRSTLLSFSHRGWERSVKSSSDARRQRSRFSALWIRMLERARRQVEQLVTGENARA